MASMHTSFDKPISVTVLKKQITKQIKSQDDLISEIMQLKYVDISQQNISKIDGLDMCSDLVTANLQCNSIYEISQITLELLPSLKCLNLSQNKIATLPDISITQIEDLNLSFNPIFINPDFLPRNLKRLSVTGVDIELRILTEMFPNLQIYQSTQLFFTEQNEVEQQLKAAGSNQATDDEVVKTKGKMNQNQPKSISKPPASARVPSGKQTPAPKTIAKTQQKPSTPTILSRINPSEFKPQAYKELVDIAEKYQTALKEIDTIKFDTYRQRIEDIISQSQSRANEAFINTKNGIQSDIEYLQKKRQEKEQNFSTSKFEQDLDKELEDFDKNYN